MLSGVFIFLGVFVYFESDRVEYENVPPPVATEPSDSKSWVEAYITSRRVNLYLALLAPVVILSACTLATAFGAKRPRSDETDDP